jgi:hypothetical protein
MHSGLFGQDQESRTSRADPDINLALAEAQEATQDWLRLWRMAPMGTFSFLYHRLRTFDNIVVHPTQEMPHPSADFYRGGPDWPHFESQILARHCWGRVPHAVDVRPHPAQREWPFFDHQLHLNPRCIARPRWRAMLRLGDTKPRSPDGPVETAENGIWCGPVCDHFGVMLADYAMRIAASNLIDEVTPLVFSIYPLDHAEPPPFFWQIIDHLRVDRRRVRLIRKPTRFDRLKVLPQAERQNGGAPSRRHLLLMDAITGSPFAADHDHPDVFVSRSQLQRGNFAGESYLDETMAAAGIMVFHPEAADLHTQLQLYRRAPRLIFSEGSAVHALQLLGHLDATVIVLTRRPGNRLAAASLRPRARSLRYLDAVRGLVHGLLASGRPQPSRGISVLDEARFVAGLASLGIDIAPFWESEVYARRRDADVAAWVEQRLALAAHLGEREIIERALRAL